MDSNSGPLHGSPALYHWATEDRWHNNFSVSMWCFAEIDHVCTCPSVSCIQSCRKLKSAAYPIIFFQPEVHEGARMCSVVVAIFTMFWHDKICEGSFCLYVEKWVRVNLDTEGKSNINRTFFQNCNHHNLCQKYKRLFQNVHTRQVGTHKKFGMTACVGPT